MKYIDFNGSSSMVNDAAYNMKTETLFLGFCSGRNYAFNPVNPHVFRKITDAYKSGDSVGSTIHRNVPVDNGIYIGSDELKDDADYYNKNCDKVGTIF